MPCHAMSCHTTPYHSDFSLAMVNWVHPALAAWLEPGASVPSPLPVGIGADLARILTDERTDQKALFGARGSIGEGA